MNLEKRVFAKNVRKKYAYFLTFSISFEYRCSQQNTKIREKNTCFLRSKKDVFCDIKNGIDERPFFEE